MKPDFDWVEIDPMGHEHRWEGEELPTLDEQSRCRRCGHQVSPGYRIVNPHYHEPKLPPKILSVSVEGRPDTIEIVTGIGTLERIAGRTRYFMKVTPSYGTFSVEEFEISEREAEAAAEAYRKGLLDVYATDLLKQYGWL